MEGGKKDTHKFTWQDVFYFKYLSTIFGMGDSVDKSQFMNSIIREVDNKYKN